MPPVSKPPPRVASDLIRGNATIVISDSIFAGGTDHTLGRESGYTSPFTVVCMRSQGRVRHLYNAGVNGDNLVNMAARFATDVVARRPAWVWIAGGTNDLNIHTLAQMKAAMQSMLTQARAARINAVVFGITGSSRGSVINAVANQFNAWLAMYCADTGVHFVDQWSLTWDNTTQAMKSAYTGDGLHYNRVGASAVGQSIWEDLATIYPFGTPYLTQAYPDGVCPLVNATFAIDTDADGVANNWTKSGSSTGVTWDRVVDDGMPKMYWQRATLSGSSVGQSLTSNIVPTGNWSVGDRISLACRVKQVDCEAGGGLASVSVFFGNDASAPTSFYAAALQSFDFDGVIYGEYVIPSGAVQMTVTLTASTVSGGSGGEVWFQRPTWVNMTTQGIA